MTAPSKSQSISHFPIAPEHEPGLNLILDDRHSEYAQALATRGCRVTTRDGFSATVRLRLFAIIADYPGRMKFTGSPSHSGPTACHKCEARGESLAT